MLERDVERYFVQRVKEEGGLQRKFTSPGRRSVTDRICGFPGNKFAFVELKATGEKPREDQLREHARWRKLGFWVCVIDTKQGVDDFVWLMTEAENR